MKKYCEKEGVNCMVQLNSIPFLRFTFNDQQNMKIQNLLD